MQLSNCVLRLNGSLLHTVPKTNVTPAEILVLQKIHGSDAVVDVRPTKFDQNRGHRVEFDRLADLYDKGAGDSAIPEEESKSILNQLFPGAMKKLPTKLDEIGMGHYLSPEAQAVAALADKAVAQAPSDPELGPHEPGAAAELQDPDPFKAPAGKAA